MSERHIIAVLDHSTGVVRTASIPFQPLIGVLAVVLCLPALVGLGAKLSADAEIEQLRAMHAVLEEENASYRVATDAFTGQIRSLAGVIDALQLNGEVSHASSNHPVAVGRATRAVAGNGPSTPALISAALLPSLARPDEIYDVLRGVLETLTNRLPSIERTVKRREELAAAAPSIWPARGWLTAPFGARSDPLTGAQGFHQGIDISTPEGQPVYAAADGSVETASYSGDYGNLVVLEHSFGLSTRYGHLSRFAVRPGGGVKRGDVVGYAGATGRATGAHVHFEILVNGAPIDPLQVLTR
jgi:murein DD-endopeptidase MepM/ murein hydrolase activator NlpD